MLAAAALAACASACAPQAAQAPARPRPAPMAPLPLPAAPAASDWRDMPLTPGAWRYQPAAGGGVALFGAPGAAPLLSLRCVRAGGQVILERAAPNGAGANQVGGLPATITTTSMQRPLIAQPDASDSAALAMAFPARDSLLDAMAFSRGRWMVEVTGLPSLIVPAWAEVGRVIEDCR